eukprot:CAMPEP_0178401484 /NCGR_PEP_ID=MMETSP0689_2-20121128/16325_1 /TAXON_ID=160604 /ORGANISM="Amphidinium massartii, Strain CS-259" /LENGTH=945 /DNA_ID=CAMNT_0020022305 /DNA_START=82 /DNA_END=2919 /DNA_ORIENTATION=+
MRLTAITGAVLWALYFQGVQGVQKRSSLGERSTLLEDSPPGPEDAASCTDFKRHAGAATLYTSSEDDMFLLLDVTNMLAGGQGPAPVLITAHASKGTYVDGTTLIPLHEPLEDTEELMLELKLSSDDSTVDVYRAQTSIRTSNPGQKRALHMGAPSIWTGSLPRTTCELERAGQEGQRDPPAMLNLDRDAQSAPHQGEIAALARKAAAHKALGERILIRGQDLLTQGFFVLDVPGQLVSYHLQRVKAFPHNFDITAQLLLQVPGEQQLVPLYVTFSVMMLPREPMPVRHADDRLGFFTKEFLDLGRHEKQQDMRLSDSVDTQVSAIWRYNMDALPNKQIRIFIDPTVPHVWRSYFREGIEAWNEAFAEIGRPHAVRAVLPGDDDWPKDYDAGDARYSTIAWSIDTTGVYSEGLAKIDPRSGEILKSDILMSHGWLRAWLGDLEEASPGIHNAKHQLNGGRRKEVMHGKKEPEAKSGKAMSSPAEAHTDLSVLAEQVIIGAGESANQTDSHIQDLLGDGLRSVVMHETGHILGLRHNFKGSLGVSLDCTRNMSCSGIHSLTASVMDYLPMNLPATGYRKVHVFPPKIGGYDKLAIQYGYLPWNGSKPHAQNHEQLQELLQLAEQYQVCLDGDLGKGDPLCVQFDLSADPLRFYSESLDLLAASQQRILNSSVQPGSSYAVYGESSAELFNAESAIGMQLVDWLGGFNVSYSHRGGNGANSGRQARSPIPSDMQLTALELLMRLLKPSSLLPPEEDMPFLVSRGDDGLFQVDIERAVRRRQSRLLQEMLQPQRLDGMSSAAAKHGGLSCEDYLTSLAASVFGKSGKQLLNETRVQANMDLQKTLVRHLKKAVAGDISEDIRTQVRFRLITVRRAVLAALDSLAKSSAGTNRPQAMSAAGLSEVSRRPSEADLSQTYLNSLKNLLAFVGGVGTTGHSKLQHKATQEPE